jgi:hypothetical protein
MAHTTVALGKAWLAAPVPRPHAAWPGQAAGDAPAAGTSAPGGAGRHTPQQARPPWLRAVQQQRAPGQLPQPCWPRQETMLLQSHTLPKDPHGGSAMHCATQQFRSKRNSRRRVLGGTCQGYPSASWAQEAPGCALLSAAAGTPSAGSPPAVLACAHGQNPASQQCGRGARNAAAGTLRNKTWHAPLKNMPLHWW